MCNINLAEKLKQYQECHSKCATKITHFIGVPLVLFALMTLASWIHIRVPGLFDISLLWVLSVAVLIYYYFMDVILAAVVTVMFLVFALIISLVFKEAPSALSIQAFLYTFIIGVILQLIGHFIEKKKPALMDGFKQGLIAPMFLAAELMFALGQKQDLKEKLK